MKYFITGATGFIGSHLVEQLLQAGHTVHALVRDKRRAQHLEDAGVRLFKGDITHRDSIAQGMEGTDGIFHLAAWYKIGSKEKYRAYGINVLGTKNVLETMQELGIKKGVYTSTLAINSDTKGKMVDESYRFTGKHLSEYDKTKWQAHYKAALPLIEEGLPLTIVLPGLVYGPGDTSQTGDSFYQYMQNILPMLPRQTAFCWAHVEDIARAHILAIEKGKPGESYIIAGEPAALTDAFNLAESITGIPAPKYQIHPGWLKLISGFLKTLHKFVPLQGPYSAEGLRVIAGTTYLGSNKKAKNELGYNPRPMHEGFRETLHFIMKDLGMEPASSAG